MPYPTKDGQSQNRTPRTPSDLNSPAQPRPPARAGATARTATRRPAPNRSPRPIKPKPAKPVKHISPHLPARQQHEQRRRQPQSPPDKPADPPLIPHRPTARRPKTNRTPARRSQMPGAQQQKGRQHRQAHAQPPAGRIPDWAGSPRNDVPRRQWRLQRHRKGSPHRPAPSAGTPRPQPQRIVKRKHKPHPRACCQIDP